MKPTQWSIALVLAAATWSNFSYLTNAHAQPTEAGPLEFTGRVEPMESVDLRPRVSGVITKIHFQPGKQVKSGELLFEIDARTYQIVLERSEAEVRLAEAKLKYTEAQADITRALGAKGSVSREEVEQTQFRAFEAKELLAIAKANLMRARLDMEFTKIRAPIDGTIGTPTLTVGNVVRENEAILANIVSTQSMRAVFQMDAKSFLSLQQVINAKKISLNQLPVAVMTSDGREIAGAKMDYFDNRLDPETNTLRVGIRIVSPPPSLLPGSMVRIAILPAKK